MKAFANSIYDEQYKKKALVKGGEAKLQKKVIPFDDFINVLKEIRSYDKQLFIYLFLLYSTGCRSKALRNAKFSDIKAHNDRTSLCLYESKTNKSFIRQIPDLLSQDLNELRR